MNENKGVENDVSNEKKKKKNTKKSLKGEIFF